MEDLATSLAALLVAECCNLGLAPVMKRGHPALIRDRLSDVGQTTCAPTPSPQPTPG